MGQDHVFIQNLNGILPAVPPDSILSRSLLQHPTLKATLFQFAAGQELSEHTASMPAVIHILEGECDLRIGHNDYTASAGTWVFMEAHTPHSLLARTDLRMLLLMLPRRDS
jgi:quercetin dioxygenase-like cupin family protein